MFQPWNYLGASDAPLAYDFENLQFGAFQTFPSFPISIVLIIINLLI